MESLLRQTSLCLGRYVLRVEANLDRACHIRIELVSVVLHSYGLVPLLKRHLLNAILLDELKVLLVAEQLGNL